MFKGNYDRSRQSRSVQGFREQKPEITEAMETSRVSPHSASN